ncbi:lysosome membrane protein 2-like isoform X2 [Macrosteles quadrilineatus]|uniref:lysosome membrane protein 2-like isoform X2 n=1 Tax=Macrosteles quadrilineatus TaxID=74068 RepID=UPI0023E1EBAC|nr:lysosome membrane protein 2-like isoform X2 [Macrosteles quadrilineatus]
MADCSSEKSSPVWQPPQPDTPPPPPPAETFITKLKGLFSRSNLNKRKQQCSRRKLKYEYGCCFTAISIVFILSTIGCIIMWFTDLYLDSILNQMTLKEGTEIFAAWQKPPVKPLICVHVFNYTNFDDYTAGKSKKLKVKETGPYCYRETLEKIDVKFYDNGTVSYGDRRTHVFEPNNSTGSINDTLIVPNVILISAEAMIRELPILVQLVVGGALTRGFNMTPMIKVPAHEFLFGYNDKFMSFMKGLSRFLHQEIPFEKFGMLAMRAAVTNDRLTITTGSNDLDEIGVVTAVNGRDKMTAWDDDECNRLDGSDGAFFPRHQINQTARLYLFHKDLCRKLPLEFQKEVDFQDGVLGMRFHTPSNVYNTTGVPIMMSFPHFMHADPAVTAHLKGLDPDPEKHDFFIDIQPILGFTLGTVSRIQVNIQVRKSKRSSQLDVFDDGTILPVVWFEVTADRLPPDLFNMIYHASVTVQWIQWSLQWGLLAISLLSAGCLLLCPCLRLRPVSVSPASPNTEIVVTKLSSV